MEKIKVLVSLSYYFPAYRAGGPVKTLQNMVEQLDNFYFSVVTRDRDLGDEKAFHNIEISSWQPLGKASVMYLSPESLSLKNIVQVINNSEFDVLYLNSFFDFNFTIKPLLARRFSLVKPCPVVLAPRGEFSPGALELKSFKKKLFIKLASWLGLYHGITWQASSELEKQDIISVLNIDPSSIFIAKDLPPEVSVSIGDLALKPNEICKIVFLSRISPKKNLDFALQVLGKVESTLVFDIYGPIEDKEYWQTCLDLIEKLPSNIVVNYCCAVTPDQVSDVFSGYDLFFFPTRGENYGHVIAESLSVGTPVLLSDQTPWQNLENDNLGWDLSLDLDLFARKIEEVANMDAQSRLSWRQQVAVNSVSKINNEQDIADNIALFEFALESFKNNHKVTK
ncbi:glycosyltransferase family 4 protein [Thiomicrospira sp.]|uniref:glycosyltransferase family 4 protein n=1 Tax=Thiomicrospira sp. TaxID=935 RepID=UPI002F941EC6